MKLLKPCFQKSLSSTQEESKSKQKIENDNQLKFKRLNIKLKSYKKISKKSKRNSQNVKILKINSEWRFKDWKEILINSKRKEKT